MAESVATPDSPRVAPRIALIVPAYGVAHLLGEALASVRAQTFTEWECIVVDDGAPDDVASAAAPFLSDPRIRLLETDNGGVSVARNRAIASCTAPLLTLLDGDDLLQPNYLATMVPLMERDPGITIATCNARIFGAVASERYCFSGTQPEGTLSNALDRSFGIYIGSTFRRSDWERAGGFDPGFGVCEDFEMWIRLLMLGGRAHYVDRVLGDYRVRAGSASADAGRMLLGNLKVYEKAARTLAPDAPEQTVLAELIDRTGEALAFEHAIDRVVDGDTAGGLADLAKLRRQVAGPVWTASFALWRLAPALARPMLRWRRHRHSRGYEPKGLARLFNRGAA
ncbi:MAG: glycosyltransferase family 2 protein [Sphingomonadaceae bacterium]|nr:glycosyltransferase family 2 protein [Sphingomonadaceae bacterium]